MQIYEHILITLGVGNLLVMIIGGYLFLQRPSVEAKKEAVKASDHLENMQTSCKFKHERLDEIIQEMRENFKTISNSILLIKENDIKHVENEMRRMSDVQTKILAIMEYQGNDKK
jgi:hypothetical protein